MSRVSEWLGWAPPDPDLIPDLPAEAIEQLDQLDLRSRIPESFGDAEQQLAPSIAEFLDAGAAKVVLPLYGIAVVALLIALIRRRLAAEHDSATPGPAAVGAALACVLLYAFGRAVDPLLASLLARPGWFPAGRWGAVGWFQWKLRGRPWAWGALRLREHPGVAFLVHTIVWVALWFVLRFALEWIWASHLRWSAPTRDLPWYFRGVGSSTTRRADQRFRRWLGIVITVLLPIHVLAGMRLAESPGSLPAPGAWVTGGLLLWMTVFHLLVGG